MDLSVGSILENIVSNYLTSVLPQVKLLRSGPDFEALGHDGKRFLIEVKGARVDPSQLDRLAKQLKVAQDRGDEFVLVTPNEPSPAQRRQFEQVFAGLSIPSKWLGIENLPNELGTPSPGDFSLPSTLANLQVASLVSNMDRYANAPIGALEGTNAHYADTKIAELSRQFSHATLGVLGAGDEPIEGRLKIAERVEQVTVVLSDVINFSSLVTASRPEDLKEAMDRYYRLARECVFKHGGMLDKFIGDAVLAVFGYPIPGPRDAVSALQFARDLISIGKEVLPQWLQELNAVIETGTRVGIATGDLWPINIGSTQIEITLLGDTINLAARLEKNCSPDEILLDNRTNSKAGREDLSYVKSLNLEQLQIAPGDAKGQQFSLRAWTTKGGVQRTEA